MRTYCLLIFILATNLFVVAQFLPDTNKNARYIGFPIIFKTPEYGYAYGLSGSALFKTSSKGDTATRTSIVQAVGFFTTRGQNIQSTEALIFFPNNNYIFHFRSAHAFFPDRFWGIGPRTPDEPYERYTQEYVSVNCHIKKRVLKQWYLGFLYDFQNILRISYPNSGLFADGNFYGKMGYVVSGAGLSMAYDSRNNVFWPEKGLYFQTQAVAYRKEFLSHYNVLKWISDLRFFKKVYRHHILAMQLYSYRTFGQTPFRDLAALGGQNNLRGFYQGRFRGNNSYSILAEYRAPVYKRFSMCLFWGLGGVYNTIGQLITINTRHSYGAGVRFSILEKEKLNARIDYGYFNKFNKGLYFTIGECF